MCVLIWYSRRGDEGTYGKIQQSITTFFRECHVFFSEGKKEIDFRKKMLLYRNTKRGNRYMKRQGERVFYFRQNPKPVPELFPRDGAFNYIRR